MLRKIMNNSLINSALNFHVNPEHCDNPQHYDTYITQNAIFDLQSGYISLKAAALTYSDGINLIGYPALEIAELAVAQKYERKGVGKEMIDFAKGTAQLLKDHIGIKHILVCADPMAEDFYKHLGFLNVNYPKEIPRESWNTACVPMYMTLL